MYICISLVQSDEKKTVTTLTLLLYYDFCANSYFMLQIVHDKTFIMRYGFSWIHKFYELCQFTEIHEKPFSIIE